MALLDKVSGPGLVRRILSSLVLAPPVLAAVHFGSPWVELLLVLAAAEMAREWAKPCDGGRAIPGGVVIAAGVDNLSIKGQRSCLPEPVLAVDLPRLPVEHSRDRVLH